VKSKRLWDQAVPVQPQIPFTIPGKEWRIVWSYEPNADYPSATIFGVVVYPKGESSLYTELISKEGDAETSGITYIHTGPNDYYLKLVIGNTQSYTIKIECDYDTVPATGINPLIIGVVLTVGIIAVVAVAYVLIHRRKTISLKRAKEVVEI
jgi:hypothetical protein